MKSKAAVSFACLAGLAFCPGTSIAQLAPGASKADAERAVQAYLTIWSHDGDIDAASIARFYAPRAVYYGKPMSRAQILADKRAYIRAWPVRHYTEVPGSLVADCNPGRSRCRVSIVMAWRRVSASGHVSLGRARIGFVFVPSDGSRKIARESAQTLADRATF